MGGSPRSRAGSTRARWPRSNPRHLLYMIWATTQHYADFGHQIETLNDGRPLNDAAVAGGDGQRQNHHPARHRPGDRRTPHQRTKHDQCPHQRRTDRPKPKVLVFARFTEDTALTLGQALVDLARAENLPIVINIRSADRTFFHAALPGSAPLNDLWARRKSATALIFQEASLLVGTRNREKSDRPGPQWPAGRGLCRSRWRRAAAGGGGGRGGGA